MFTSLPLFPLLKALVTYVRVYGSHWFNDLHMLSIKVVQDLDTQNFIYLHTYQPFVTCCNVYN